MCSNRFVSKANIVLLEFEPNLQVGNTRCGSSSAGLVPLIAAVRQVVPKAAVVAVGWPSAAKPWEACEASLKHELPKHGADLVLASPVLHLLGHNSHSTDRVHPTFAGGALLAQSVARLLTRRMVGASSCDIRLNATLGAY